MQIKCAFNINNEEFLIEQLKQVDDTRFELWNDTSIGNAACIALYGPTKELKEKYSLILKKYISWRKVVGLPYSEYGGPLSDCVIL